MKKYPELLNKIKTQWKENDEVSRKLFYCRKIMESGSEIFNTEPNEELQIIKIKYLCKFYGFKGISDMLDFYSANT